MSVINSTDPAVRFQEIFGFPEYCVGTNGSVWSLWQKVKLVGEKGFAWVVGVEWTPMRLGVDSGGYHHVILSRGGKKYIKKVHHLVLEAFVGARLPGQECRHLNGVRDDNRLENLVWGTKKENYQDSVRHGTVNRGENHLNAVLTEEEVIEILNKKHSGETTASVAAQYGVTRGTVCHIWSGRSWKHVLPGTR